VYNMGIPFRNNDRIVFVGDSITESGRFSQPPLGNGYVYIFYNLLLAKYPEIDVEVINSGISGNTVKDLMNRWDDDVISLKPNWISIMIGINDIHRYLGGVDPDLDPESYYNIYRSILEKTTRALPNVRLILISPFYISIAKDGWRKRVLETIPMYIEKVEKLSREFSAIYIDMHRKFMDILRYRDPMTYTHDAIHPNFAGHMIIALTILETLEKL